MSEPVGRQRSGLASAASLTPEERILRARHAADTRWAKSKPKRAARRFLRELFGEYVKVYRSAPELLTGLVRPLLIWDSQLEAKESKSDANSEV